MASALKHLQLIGHIYGGLDGGSEVQFHFERSWKHICQIGLCERLAPTSIVVGSGTLILFLLCFVKD